MHMEENVRKIAVALFCGLAALSAIAPANAASRPRGSTQGQPATVADWNQHDAAVYVVSTLNLLRTRQGRPVSAIMQNRLGIRRFNVYADNAVPDLYYIDLARGDGSVLGTLAYKMGWQKPMSASAATDRFRIPRAADSIVVGYRIDRKTLIGTFTSTLPA